MSDERLPIEILLADMRRRLAQGGLTYAEAVILDDIATTIGEAVTQAAADRESGHRDPQLPRRPGQNEAK